MPAMKKMPVGGSGGVKATGVRRDTSSSQRLIVGSLCLLAGALVLAIIAALARVGALEEELRRVSSHKEHHRMAVERCLASLEQHRCADSLLSWRDNELTQCAGAGATPRQPRRRSRPCNRRLPSRRHHRRLLCPRLRLLCRRRRRRHRPRLR